MAKRRKSSPTERDFVTQRADGRCEYCQTPLDFSPESFEMEHIIPLAKGGSNELDNLALSCGGCNNRKGDKTSWNDPETGAETDLFHPRTDTWSEHFGWADGDAFVEGKMAKGRATVEALDLNRKGLVNLRRALSFFGVHPSK